MTSAADAADQIAQALARLRGRRGPGPHDPAGEHRGGRGPHDRSGEHRGGPHGGMRGEHRFGPGARFGGPARFRMLETLAAASDPLTVGQIADAVGVDQPRASRLVQQSVEMGLVEREADPDDARRTRIVLTEQGRAIVRGFRGDRRAAIATALADFSDEERDELARLLGKLADAWPSP